MKPIRLALIAGLLILPVGAVLTAVTFPQIFAQTQNRYTGVAKQVDDIAGQITVLINSKNSGNGSGAIIAKEGNTYYVLTAAHVVQNPDTYTLVAPDGTQYNIDKSQITLMAEADLAIVKFTSQKTYSVATLARYNLKDNFWVFVSGFPKAMQGEQRQRLLTAGRVHKQDEADFAAKDQYSLNSGGRGLVYTSLSMAGMSGGPILDSRGYMVGINTAAENELDITDKGQTVEISTGFSLGVPIGTFAAQSDKAQIKAQWLQEDFAAPPDLTTADVESITTSLGQVQVPDANANAVDWLNYGNQLWRLGRYDEAVSAFDKAIALKSDFDRAYYGKGLALWNAGKYQESLAAFEKTTQLAASFSPAWRYQGNTLRWLKQYDLALAAYDKAIALQSDDFVLYIERGVILHDLKQYTEAITTYNKALKLKPHPWIYNNRGLAYHELQQYQKAIADYNSALAINPDYADAYNNRGNVYRDLKEYRKAIADYDKATSLNSELAVAYNNRGIIHYELQDSERALLDLNQAILLNPNLTYAYYNRGTVYAGLQDYYKALNDYNSAISREPNLAQAYYNRGIAYTRVLDYQSAIADFSKAISLNAKDAQSYNNRGYVYKQLKDYQKALADFNRAISLNPNYLDAYLNRGTVYDEQKDYQKALADYDKAISIDPNFAEAYGNRGLTYARMGDRENAIANIEKAGELFCQQGSTEDCQKAQGILQQLQGGGN